MNEEITNPSHDDIDIKEYKNLETRLYGEIIKACRRYSHKLSIISITGILDIVKQEMRDLEKTNIRFMKEEREPENEGFNEF
jgi:hypothetical protein